MSYPVLRVSTVLFFIILALPLSTFGQLPKEVRQLKTVVIDAGHGGNDPGTVVGGVREKDLVLSVALRLGNKIKNGFPDVTVVYTRTNDVFIPLYERASKAIRKKADVFISIHANYVSASSVRGTETFTLGLHRSQENLEVAKKENSVILLEDDYTSNYQGFNPKETESYIMFDNMQSEYQSQSIALAANIQDEFTQNIGLKNRGVKQAGFLVLRQTSMPAVLIEIGFISNPSEQKFLVSESGKEKIAESIYKAFSDYKKMIDLKSRFDITSEGQPVVSAEISGTSYSEFKRDTQSEKGAGQTYSLSDTSTFSVNSRQQNASDTVINQQFNTISSTVRTKTTSGSLSKSDLDAEKNKLKVSSGNILSNQEVRTEPENKEVYYSVQIGALNVAIDPSPENFNGEKNIFRIQVQPFFKFFSGKFQTPEDAFKEKIRLKNKYQDAFVVIFENDIPRIYKKK